jgi:hypothetical protein
MIVKSNYYVIFTIVKLFGYFRINLFILVDRVNNFFFNRFFRKLYSKDFNTNPLQVKKIMSRFRVRSKPSTIAIDDILVNFFFNKTRIQDNSLKLEESRLLEGVKYLSFRKLMLLSSLFSRLGYFTLEVTIEKIAFDKLQLLKKVNIYELFCILKYSLYYDVDYYLYIEKKYKIKSLLENQFKYHKIYIKNFDKDDKEIDRIFLLGPLRTINDLYLEESNQLFLGKPSELEVDLIIQTKRKAILLSQAPIVFNPLGETLITNILETGYEKYRNPNHFRGYEVPRYVHYQLLNGYPMQVQRMILTLLLREKPRFIHASKMNMYLGNQIYAKNYLRFQDGLYSNTLDFDSKKVLLWRMGWHSLISNFRFTKLLYLKGYLVPDKQLNEILSLSVEEYANRLDEIYS